MKRDRYAAKWEGVEIYLGQGGYTANYGKKQIVWLENIPQFVKTIYNDPKIGLIGYEKLYEKIKMSYLGVLRRRLQVELNKLDDYQIHKGVS